MKIMSVVGARPNFMKIAPICEAILSHNLAGNAPHIEHLIVHTGQHYDDLMSSRFFTDLGLPRPHLNLDIRSGSHAVQTAKIMERFEPILMEKQPDVLLLVGDVNSTLACALVASKISYKRGSKRSRPIIAHVEAGLRSFDRDMPEEVNRLLTDAISDILFITEGDASHNLGREGIAREKVYFVGNVMIDTLVCCKEKARLARTLDNLGLRVRMNGAGYGIVTLHRPSNVDEPESLARLVNCVAHISKRLPLVFPLHPRTGQNLRSTGLYEILAKNDGILLTDPLGYLDFLSLLLDAILVLTDSGGIQEETTFLKVPCITLRKNTERPVTVTLGTNYLVDPDPDAIIHTATCILEGKAKKGSIPPLWDGCASKRILDILVEQVGGCCHHERIQLAPGWMDMKQFQEVS